MCVFSCLVDPFYYTLFLTALYTLIAKIGFTRAAEGIYSAILMVFGRKDYKAFLASWKELKVAKTEVSKVSAQDQFAKWAKLQRKVDKLQVDFDKQYSSRQKSLLAVQWVGAIVLRVVCYVAVTSFLYLHANQSVLSLDLFKPNLESTLIESALAFPLAEKGTVSVLAWSLLVGVAFKEVLRII